MLDEAKAALRVDGTDNDAEISNLIEACKIELIQAGVDPAKLIDTDALYKLAVIQFCKSYFDSDERMTDKFRESYEGMKRLMSLSSDYRVVLA